MVLEVLYRFQIKMLKYKTRKHIEQTARIPATLPRVSRDFALSSMASRSKLTECIDICTSIPFTCEDFLLEERGGVLGLILSAIALVIRGLRLLISIP